MAIVKWKNRDLYDSWSDLRSLQESINDLFDFDHFPGNTGLFDRKVSPALDVIENTNEFIVACELPGLNLEDVDVSITSNVLTIKGSKNEDHEESQGKYYRKESWGGNFQRTLPMPTAVDAARISAELQDGILTITLPKREEARPKQIAVKIK